MTRAKRDILRKKRVLEHAERIGNIRKACRYYGVSRAAFYLWKKAYETYGDEGLVNKKPCPFPSSLPAPNPNIRPGQVLRGKVRTFPWSAKGWTARRLFGNMVQTLEKGD
jgi:hypothetical protein